MFQSVTLLQVLDKNLLLTGKSMAQSFYTTPTPWFSSPFSTNSPSPFRVSVDMQDRASAARPLELASVAILFQSEE
jgi:hypothetical protein